MRARVSPRVPVAMRPACPKGLTRVKRRPTLHVSKKHAEEERPMSWTSPYPPVEVGGTTLQRMVLEAAAHAGNRPALVDGATGIHVTYRLLAERVQGVAA